MGTPSPIGKSMEQSIIVSNSYDYIVTLHLMFFGCNVSMFLPLIICFLSN